MLIEIYIMWHIVAIILFFIAFFTKQEIIWSIILVISGVLMFTSWDIQYYIYEFNATISAYQPVFTHHSYPYLMALNMVFFVLALILGLFDLFDKYGTKFAGEIPEQVKPGFK